MLPQESFNVQGFWQIFHNRAFRKEKKKKGNKKIRKQGKIS